MVVHGLFQTPAYATEVLKAGRTSQETEDLVKTRMERQEIFNRPGLSQIVLIVDEGVLRRPIGGPSIMKEQLLHLIMRAEDPRITLQVVPSTTGAYAGLPGAFTILGFIRDPEVVYVEGHTAGQFVDRPVEVHQYALRYNLIRGTALSADQSLELLHVIVEGL
ncbi:hypothetical protein GCM10023085_71170 [Actinomadura viridis]|uniref:DUF5753 domain-containing protein n=1 Tax=Actinomadura viridis TaxID=58110 RepID=A0A931GN46_9ACTN|nr:DUF5753 domain-containing protein [Actinomadura viridis]MBG6089136.1 hypothetical protein [Actinomadura viridis]